VAHIKRHEAKTGDVGGAEIADDAAGDQGLHNGIAGIRCLQGMGRRLTQEALRLGMVNEVVAHDALMDTARALAQRIALVPEPAVRLNKAITMLGIQAAGVHSGLLLEGALGALAHASHNELRERLLEAQRAHGLKGYLDMRDGPFQPEPMGPRSAKGGKKKAGK